VTAVPLKPCSSDGTWHFRGTCHPGLHFYPPDRSNVFPWITILSLKYTVLQAVRPRVCSYILLFTSNQKQSIHIVLIMQSCIILKLIKSAQSDTAHKKQNGAHPLSSELYACVTYCNCASKTESVNKFHRKVYKIFCFQEILSLQKMQDSWNTEVPRVMALHSPILMLEGNIQMSCNPPPPSWDNVWKPSSTKYVDCVGHLNKFQCHSPGGNTWTQWLLCSPPWKVCKRTQD
jgi:hypothetical protein